MHFQDMLERPDLYRNSYFGMDLEGYKADVKTKSAVERQLQILTEAAYRIDSQSEVFCPGLDWAALRGMGNILRHDYHRVDDEIIWNTIIDEIPAVISDVGAALKVLALPAPE